MFPLLFNLTAIALQVFRNLLRQNTRKGLSPGKDQLIWLKYIFSSFIKAIQFGFQLKMSLDCFTAFAKTNFISHALARIIPCVDL